MRKRRRGKRRYQSLRRWWRHHRWLGRVGVSALLAGAVVFVWFLLGGLDSSRSLGAVSVGTPVGDTSVPTLVSLPPITASNAASATLPPPVTVSNAGISTSLPTRTSTEVPRSVPSPTAVKSAPPPASPTAGSGLAQVDCGQGTAGSDWSTYSNSPFQFSFRYPPALSAVEQAKVVADILHSTRFVLPKDASLPQPNEIDITIFDNPFHQPTQTWFEAHRKPVNGSAALFENVADLRHCSVDNLDAVYFQETTMGSVHRILVSRANRIFSILVVDYNNSDWMKNFLAMAATIRWNASSR